MNIPPGTHRAVPVAYALGYTSKGRLQIGVTLEFLDHNGQRLTWYGYFSDRAAPVTIKALRAMGWRGNDIRDFAYGGQWPEGFGQEVMAVVEEDRDQNGNPRTVVRWINSGGVPMKKLVTPEELEEYAARINEQLRKAEASLAEKGGSVQGTTGDSYSDSVPF